MIPDREIATAADYADAMLTARRAKNILLLLLVLLVLGQLTLFLLLRFDVVSTSAVASTQPATTQSAAVEPATLLHYLSGGCLFLGLVVSIVLSLVLLLIVNIMLVGRLIGVGRLVSAYVWCLLLLVLLFPWQAFLNNVNLTMEQAPFKVPGVLYTWSELTDPAHGANFPTENTAFAALKWIRYVAMPVVALILLLLIQVKSNRGMRQALGEDETIVVDGATEEQ